MSIRKIYYVNFQNTVSLGTAFIITCIFNYLLKNKNIVAIPMLTDFFSKNFPEIKKFNISLGKFLFDFNIPTNHTFENYAWNTAFELHDELKTFAKFLNPSFLEDQKSHQTYKNLIYYYIQSPINFESIKTAVQKNNVFSIKKDIYKTVNNFLNENNLKNYDTIHYVPSFRWAYKKNTRNDHIDLLNKACSLVQTEKVFVATSEDWVIDHIKNKLKNNIISSFNNRKVDNNFVNPSTSFFKNKLDYINYHKNLLVEWLIVSKGQQIIRNRSTSGTFASAINNKNYILIDDDNYMSFDELNEIYKIFKLKNNLYDNTST